MGFNNKATDKAHEQLMAARDNAPLKVTIVGSGNWGSAIAKLVGTNCATRDSFKDQVDMWVFEEEVDGQKLSEIINTAHENVKYLPGIDLGANVRAVPDLVEACRDSNILVFVLPHQFLGKILPKIRDVVAPDAFGISLIKGIDFDESGILLVSDIIREHLPNMDMSVLMGANVANEVAKEEFAEATIGGNKVYGETLKMLFQTKYFSISNVEDAAAVELCGAMKNIVALGAGFSDGLGWGNNTKAAIIRIGMKEMAKLIELHTGSDPSAVMLESCGAADLITTCYGGRNRKCAEAFIKTGKSWSEIEKDLLNGQKLQGTLTCEEIHRVLTNTKDGNVENEFPLMRNIYQISFEGANPETLILDL